MRGSSFFEILLYLFIVWSHVVDLKLEVGHVPNFFSSVGETVLPGDKDLLLRDEARISLWNRNPFPTGFQKIFLIES